MDLKSGQVKVNVVGGGFSGLVSAYFLQKQGFKVMVFEKEAHLGGVIQTEHHDFGLVETAANAFLNTVDLQAICSDIGCTLISTLPQSRRRYFFRDNRLSRFPLRWYEIPGFIFRAFKLLFVRDLRPRQGESMLSWAERNFGKAAALHIVSTALNGIYSGDARTLSAELIVGPFFDRTTQPQKGIKRGSVAPYLGMGDFVHCLKRHLDSQGVEFFEVSVTPEMIAGWQREGQTSVLCVGAKIASQLLSKVDGPKSQLLGRIETMPLISAQVFWQEPCAQLNGFGALVDQDEKLKVLGVLANNRIFANRGSKYSETWIFGGKRSPEVASYSDEEVWKLIERESLVMFKQQRVALGVHIHKWADVLPHYDFTLQEVLKNMKKTNSIYLIGNFTGRIGLSKILEQAKILAQEVANDCRQNRGVVDQRGHSQVQSEI